MVQDPFNFTPKPVHRLVDETNNLEFWQRGGPDYTYDLEIRVCQAPGDVDGHPDIYLIFYFEGLYYSPKSKLWGADVDPRFHKRFPGRLAELLDAVLPLAVPFMMAPFEGGTVSYEPLPEGLRSSLLEKGSYRRDRHNPETAKDSQPPAPPRLSLGQRVAAKLWKKGKRY